MKFDDCWSLLLTPPLTFAKVAVHVKDMCIFRSYSSPSLWEFKLVVVSILAWLRNIGMTA
jgi:hypothetical protein